jgi:FKBP-type peptidyl-prolyl cis-trans isomerase FkpA
MTKPGEHAMRACRIFVCISLALTIIASCELAFAAKPGPVDKDAPEEFTATPSGLKYRIRRKSGGDHPGVANSVVAHYKGWFDDGTEFDSSYAKGKPAEFRVTGVIKGWTEGLQLIGKGGMIELEVPPELGYGKKGFGNGVIPPDTRLHFLVELIDIR